MRSSFIFSAVFILNLSQSIIAQNTEPPHYDYPNYRGYRSYSDEPTKKRINLSFLRKSEVSNPYQFGGGMLAIDGGSSFLKCGYLGRRMSFRGFHSPDITVQYAQLLPTDLYLNSETTSTQGGQLMSHVSYDLVPMEWLDVTVNAGITFGYRTAVVRLDENYIVSNLSYGVLLGSSARFHFLSIFGKGLSFLANCHYNFDFSNGNWQGNKDYQNELPSKSKINGLQFSVGIAYAVNRSRTYRHLPYNSRVIEPIF